MYLRQLDIVEFRGIKRLSITLRPNMVLIGENAWGKSSLLAALSLILNPETNYISLRKAIFTCPLIMYVAPKLRCCLLLANVM